MKNVVFWTARKVPVRKNGQIVPGEFTGAFATAVAPGTPGSHHYVGESGGGSIKWDKHELEATAVRGHLRWIDKVLPPFKGASAQIVLFLETDAALHRVAIRYDASNLMDVMNNLCGLGKHLATSFLNMGYWVRKAIDSQKRIKTNDKGDVIWKQSVQFYDVAPQFTFEEWRDFSQTNALDWVQRTAADGSKQWDTSAALKYWDTRLVAIQRYLLQSEVALPFTYGSLVVCEAENPSGGGNLTKEEIAECVRIWERIKGDYKMPFGAATVDADQALANAAAGTPIPAQPTYDEELLPNLAPAHQAAELPPTFEDDLPF